MAEKLVLVRHGEGAHNLTGRLNGIRSQQRGEVIPLTPLGRRQMRRSALQLERETKAEMILSSPIERTIESADKVAPRFDLNVIIEDLLTERDFGIYDGKTITEIIGPAKPGDTRSEQQRLSAWVRECIASGGEGMESSQSVEQRMRILLHLVRGYHPQTIIGFSHSDTIRSAAAVVLGQSELSLSELNIPYGSFTVISLPRQTHRPIELVAAGVTQIDKELAAFLRP